MRYKLVAIDIDGTLLDNQQRIPAANVRAIKELTDSGVRFVVVTGRPDVMTREYVQELGIKAPVLGCNGATMRDVLSNEIYHLRQIQQSTLRELYDFFNVAALYPRYYALDAVYSFNPHEFDETRNPFAIFSKRLSQHMEFRICNDIEELLQPDIAIAKLVYITNEFDKLLPLQQEIGRISGVDVYQASSNSLDIVTKSVSKGRALLKYAESLGIKAAEIVAIGDSENDLSMLQVVGMPVAMGNASAGLKAAAKIVTANNDEAGVAVALREIFR